MMSDGAGNELRRPARAAGARARLSRWNRHLHFATLWSVTAVIFALGFLAHHHLAPLSVGVVVAVVAAGGMLVTRDAGHVVAPRLEDPILAVLGAVAAGALVRGASLAPVLAATLVGVLGGLAVRYARGARDYHGAPIYSGAFVGVSSTFVFANFWWLAVAGALTGLFWSLSREAWVGIGGKMGTTALTGALATALVARAVHQLGPGAPLMNFDSIAFFVVVLCVASALVTHYLAFAARFGAVLGSAVPTALFSALVVLFHPWGVAHDDAVMFAWYTASFVGMTAPHRLVRPGSFLSGAGVVAAVLSMTFAPTLSGMGGTAGATALFSVFFARGVGAARERLRRRAAMRELSSLPSHHDGDLG